MKVNLINIAKFCLDADNKKGTKESKELTVKVIDTITLLGKGSQQTAIRQKDRLKFLSEDYRPICDQDHLSCIFLLGDNFADNIRRAKTTYTINQSISAKKQRTSASSTMMSRNLSTAASSSRIRLNYQDKKKNFSN